MAPTVMALGYDEIDAGAFYLHRVLHLAHHGAHLGAVGLEPIHPGSGIAKARHVNGHLLLNNHFHLGFKKLCGQGQGLIGIAGDLEAFRIRGLKAEFIHKLLGKTLERRYLLRRGGRFTGLLLIPGPADGRRQQRVHAKGLIGEGSGTLNPLPELLRAAARSPEDPKAASIRHRRRQLRRAGAPHARQEHGNLDTKQIANAGFHRHRFSPL